MFTLTTLITAVVALLGGTGLGYVIRKKHAQITGDQAELRAEKLLAETRAKQQELLQEAKNTQQELLISAKEKGIKIIEEAKNYFKPEFLNRVDEIITFHPLNEKQIRLIVDLQLAIVARRLLEKKITLEITERAKDWLAKKGYDLLLPMPINLWRHRHPCEAVGFLDRELHPRRQ